MSMTLEFADALQSIRLKYKGSNSIAIEHAVITRAEWDAIDARLAHPAQSADESMVDRMILEYMRMEPDDVKIVDISPECSETREFCRSLLTAALQEKGNG